MLIKYNNSLLYQYTSTSHLLFSPPLLTFHLHAHVPPHSQSLSYVQAKMVINSIPALTAEFKLDRSHSTMVAFLRLITDFLKLHLLMAMIDDKKLLLALHLFAFQVYSIILCCVVLCL